MKGRLLFICVAALSLLLTGCDKFVPAKELDALQQENSALSTQNLELRTQLKELQSAVDELKSVERDAQEDADPFDARILESLLKRKDLIPVGGEDIAFFPELCYVLGERYVYAYAEDGRASADMIFSYKQESDGGFAWRLELYNIGNEWLIVDPETGLPKLQEPVDTEAQGPQQQEGAAPPPVAVGGILPSTAGVSPIAAIAVPTEAQQAKFREIAELIG